MSEGSSSPYLTKIQEPCCKKLLRVLIFADSSRFAKISSRRIKIPQNKTPQKITPFSQIKNNAFSRLEMSLNITYNKSLKLNVLLLCYLNTEAQKLVPSRNFSDLEPQKFDPANHKKSPINQSIKNQTYSPSEWVDSMITPLLRSLLISESMIADSESLNLMIL